MESTEKIEFFDQFIDLYLSMGFGAVSKRDIDLFIFHQLTKSRQYRNMSNYELANHFKIPEAKIKQLKLNSGLKFAPINSKVILGNLVIRIARSNQFKGLKDGLIEISLENPLEKRELENFLKLNNGHAEYVLNSEVLKISPIQLFELLAENLENPDTEFNKIIQNSTLDEKLKKEIVSKALSLRQKLDKLREKHLTIENFKSLITAGIGLII